MGKNATKPIGLRPEVFDQWARRRERRRRELGMATLSWNDYFGMLNGQMEEAERASRKEGKGA